MRWIILGLFVLNIMQSGFFIYSEKFNFLGYEPIQTKSINFDLSNIKKMRPKKQIHFSNPICSIKVQSLSMANKEYSAKIKYQNKIVTLNKGQFIAPDVSIHSISPLGLVLHHGEFLQSIVPIRNTANKSEIYKSTLENNPYPNPPPLKGFYEKNIPDKYSNNIKIISNNVLSINRNLFNEILSSREILKTVSFGLSPSGGFQARKIIDDSVFSSLGLEQADIIKSINNRDLKSVNDLISLYQQKDSTNLIELRLERRGQEVYYFYQLHD